MEAKYSFPGFIPTNKQTKQTNVVSRDRIPHQFMRPESYLNYGDTEIPEKIRGSPSVQMETDLKQRKRGPPFECLTVIQEYLWEVAIL